MSNPNIDRWYELGRENGALGGKLVGAGAGGFLLFYTRETRRLRTVMAADGLAEVRFRTRPILTDAMQCIILAGGIGTRMWPETRTIPKTLLPVHGKPFAAWQLSWLARSGIDSVVYCIGYLGDAVRAYVGDGSHWGISVVYVDEGEHLRGTAGALRLALDSCVLEDDFLVLYGDSWLQVDPAAVLLSLRGRPEPALMTVHRNEGQWDASNVIFDGRRVVRYAKGLSRRPAQMCWIDYGLTAFHRSAVAERVPPATVFDLAPMLSALAAEGQLAGFEVPDRFYEIGSPQGRAELEALLREQPPR